MLNDRHRRVLVIDGDHELRERFASLLRLKSLIVDEAEDGRVAIERLAEVSYAMILLDLMLPVVDGYSVLEALDPNAADPPVVLVMSGAERPVLGRIDSRRIHGIVRKPFDLEEIASVVAACAEVFGVR